MSFRLHLLAPRALSAIAWSLVCLGAAAQAPAAPAAAASAPATQQLDPVQITGTRANETQERRQSTAAKIVVGRDEIERHGDSTLGEVLKRLPGITVQGAPGRPGGIRMRGLSGGYVLILLDGERVSPGFSIDTLSPDQIERIEILRAPTAETGARAIAGTINIVTREGYRKRLNNLRVGAALEHGRTQPGFSWTRNDSAGPVVYTYTLSAFRMGRDKEARTLTTRDDGVDLTRTHELATSHDVHTAVHASGRLQWRGERGSSLVLMPFVVHSRTDNAGQTRLTREGGAAPYDQSLTSTLGDYSAARLNGQWNQLLQGAGRLELKGGYGQSRWKGRTLRQPRMADGSLPAPPLRDYDDVQGSRGSTATLGSKYITAVGDGHSLVAGAEAESQRLEERHTESDDGDDYAANSLRLAAYAQDEWNVTPRWAVHAGLRWEGVTTRSDSAGVAVKNRSGVWTPLLHTVYKLDAQSRDQLRLSLTRSYKAPTVQNLVGRTRTVDLNSATTPDRAGNPELRPELATGLDLAVERYLAGGGMLSASVYHRRHRDTLRSVTALEGTRWVSRMRNVGGASSQGVELEAKFRLSDVLADAPRIDLRANASVFRSRVDGVPGPDNRLDQQPGGTLNLGADYRFRVLPLTAGVSYNWTPATTARVSESEWGVQGRKRVTDAYLLYAFNPETQLRLSGSNLDPDDHHTTRRFEDGALRETSETSTRSYVNWRLQLELKL